MTNVNVSEEQTPAAGRSGGCADVPVLDPQVYEHLMTSMGRDTMTILLGKLTRQLADLVVAGATSQPDRKLLAESAHAMVSAAGLMGFPRLSRSCHDLEQACTAHADLDGAVAEVLEAREQALAAIATLRAAA